MKGNSLRDEERRKLERAAQRRLAFLEKFRTERSQIVSSQARDMQRQQERQTELREQARKQRVAEHGQLRRGAQPQAPARAREQPPRIAPGVSDQKRQARGAELRKTVAPTSTPKPPSERKIVGQLRAKPAKPVLAPKKIERRELPGRVRELRTARTQPTTRQPEATPRISARQAHEDARGRRSLLRREAAAQRLGDVEQLRASSHAAGSRAADLRQQQAEIRNADRNAADAHREKRSLLQKRAGMQRVEQHRGLRAPAQVEPKTSPALRSTVPGQRGKSRKTLLGAAQPAGRAQARARAARPRATASVSYAEPADTLSWLHATASFAVDENGSAVSLRGITVAGLDTVASVPGQALAEGLSLDAVNLAALADQWGINLVRLPFQAQTILNGNASFPPDALLCGLDDLIFELASLNIYVLLAMQAPPAQGATQAPLPDQSAFDCWKLLAMHYQDEPAVLFEIYSASGPLQGDWAASAQMLIGSIRREHPASLLFVGSGRGGADTTGLPLRFTTGDPTPNLVYTISMASGQDMGASVENALAALSQSFPVLASDWSNTRVNEFDRTAESAANLFSRRGIGWAAANWNAEPRLVLDAGAHNFVPTRWGNAVQRAMTLPLREPLERLLPQ